MWALQAWGELALGLAAPRAVHAVGNDYGNQTLAWDVVSMTTLLLFGVVDCYRVVVVLCVVVELVLFIVFVVLLVLVWCFSSSA